MSNEIHRRCRIFAAAFPDSDCTRSPEGRIASVRRGPAFVNFRCQGTGVSGHITTPHAAGRKASGVPRNRPVRASSATARHACHPVTAPCVKVLLTITTHTRTGTDVAITRPLADPRRDGADGSSLGAPADDFLVLDVVYLRRHRRMAQSKAWEQAEPVRLGSGHLISPGGTATCRRRTRPHALIGERRFQPLPWLRTPPHASPSTRTGLDKTRLPECGPHGGDPCSFHARRIEPGMTRAP